jgi:hypothetical protein
MICHGQKYPDRSRRTRAAERGRGAAELNLRAGAVLKRLRKKASMKPRNGGDGRRRQ